MNFIKKFYEAAISENAGGGAEAVAEQNIPQPSMAELMAKHGSKSDETGVAPVDIKEKEEVKPEAETAVKVEEAKKEEPKPEPIIEAKEDPKVEEKAPVVQETPKVQTLQEVLKNEQPETIFKELGFNEQTATFLSELKEADPKILGIVQAWKEGKLGDYVKELSTDYQKMSPEELMRHQLRQEYPKASEKQLNILYKSEVVEKYKLDPDVYSEEEVEEGRELLAVKADKYRDSFSENQQKYLLPDKPAPKEVVPDNTAELQRQQIEAYVKEVKDNQYTKDIVSNKSIKIGDGEEAFNLKVEPDDIVDFWVNPNKIAGAMEGFVKGEDGKPIQIDKTKHQLAVAAFAIDPKGFFKNYASHMKSLGAKAVIDPLDNASKPDGATTAKSDSAPKSVAEAMAKSGRRVD